MLRIMFWMIGSVAVFWVVSLAYFIHLIPRTPVGDSVTTQAIVVLTGGSLRISYGFELLEKEKAQQLFISGIAKQLTLDEVLTKHGATDRVREMAMKEHRITLGFEADSTRGNAIETADWVKKESIKSIRLVTANYHLPRSMMELGRTMPHLIIIPDPVFPDRFQMEGDWWKDTVTRTLVLSEFHKYLAAWLYGLIMT